jgi:hypothetical protein
MISRPSLPLTRLAAGVLAALTPVSAHAQAQAQTLTSPEGMRFVWNRGPEAASCAEASEVEADVVKRLGWNPFSPDGKSSIECHVTREDGVWTAAIEERDEQGARAGYRVVTSPAESCASLGSAVGLAIALIVRSRGATPPPPPPPAVIPTPPPCPPCKQEIPEKEGVRASWSVSGIGAIGVLPKAAFGASLDAAVSLSRSVSLAADVSFLPEVSETSSLGEFGFGATWGTLGACYDVEFGADVGMSGCVSAMVGTMHVAVYEPTPVKGGAHVFAGATAGPALRWRFAPPAHLALGVDGFFPFKRTSFLVEDAGTTESLYEQPAAGVLFTLGVGVSP